MTESLKDTISSIKAAELLGVSRQWIAQLCREGVLEATKFGRDWIITRSSLEAYREQQDKDKKDEHPGTG